MHEEMFFLAILDFFIKFWFFSLVLRFLIGLLPGKLSDMIRFIGNTVRFPVKRFFYWLYGVKVLETDMEKSVFKTEKVHDFDCRITANIAGPLLILTYIGSISLYWANYIYNLGMTWLGISLYVFGFSIILMTAPDLSEVAELGDVRVKSIFKWILKIALVSVPAYLLLHYFVQIEALAQGAFVLGMLVPFYFHKHSESSLITSASPKGYVEYDPFAE